MDLVFCASGCILVIHGEFREVLVFVLDSHCRGGVQFLFFGGFLILLAGFGFVGEEWVLGINSINF